MSIHLLGGQYHRLYKLLTGLSRQEALHLRGGDLADISARSAARPVPAALWPGMATCWSVCHRERSVALCLSVCHRERSVAISQWVLFCAAGLGADCHTVLPLLLDC